jgi:hypothetical protein
MTKRHSKTDRQNAIDKIVPGSLWLCNDKNWYLYYYNPTYIRYEPKPLDRHLKFVHKNLSDSQIFMQKEELITENHALLAHEHCFGMFEFTYKLEKILLRDEFIYKFLEHWTRANH